MTREPVTHIIHCDKCEDYDRLAADVEGLQDAANEREIFYAGLLNEAERTRVTLQDKHTSLLDQHRLVKVAVDAVVADATLLPEGCPEPWREWIVENVKLLDAATRKTGG